MERVFVLSRGRRRAQRVERWGRWRITVGWRARGHEEAQAEAQENEANGHASGAADACMGRADRPLRRGWAGTVDAGTVVKCGGWHGGPVRVIIEYFREKEAPRRPAAYSRGHVATVRLPALRQRRSGCCARAGQRVRAAASFVFVGIAAGCSLVSARAQAQATDGHLASYWPGPERRTAAVTAEYWPVWFILLRSGRAGPCAGPAQEGKGAQGSVSVPAVLQGPPRRRAGRELRGAGDAAG